MYIYMIYIYRWYIYIHMYYAHTHTCNSRGPATECWPHLHNLWLVEAWQIYLSQVGRSGVGEMHCIWNHFLVVDDKTQIKHLHILKKGRDMMQLPFQVILDHFQCQWNKPMLHITMQQHHSKSQTWPLFLSFSWGDPTSQSENRS